MVSHWHPSFGTRPHISQCLFQIFHWVWGSWVLTSREWDALLVLHMREKCGRWWKDYGARTGKFKCVTCFCSLVCGVVWSWSSHFTLLSLSFSISGVGTNSACHGTVMRIKGVCWCKNDWHKLNMIWWLLLYLPPIEVSTTWELYLFLATICWVTEEMNHGEYFAFQKWLL